MLEASLFCKRRNRHLLREVWMGSASFSSLAIQEPSEWITLIYINCIWTSGFDSPFLVTHLTLKEVWDYKEAVPYPFLCMV